MPDIPWNEGGAILALANMRERRGQQKLQAISGITGSVGSMISAYRTQKDLDQQKQNELDALARSYQTPEEAAAQAAAAGDQQQNDTPTVDKTQPAKPVEQQSVGSHEGVGQGVPWAPNPNAPAWTPVTWNEPQETASPGTKTATDVQTSKQPSGAKPEAPTQDNTANTGAPATKDQATATPPEAPSATALDRMGTFAKGIPGKAYSALSNLAGSRFAHRIGDIFGVSDPWRENIDHKIALMQGRALAEQREAKLLGLMNPLMGRVEGVGGIRTAAPNLAAGISPDDWKLYPPHFGQSAGATQWAIRLEAMKDPNGPAAAAVKMYDYVQMYKSLPPIAKLGEWLSNMPPEQRQNAWKIYSAMHAAGWGGPETTEEAMRSLDNPAGAGGPPPELSETFGFGQGGTPKPSGGGDGGGGRDRPSADDPIPNTPENGVDPLDSRFKAAEERYPILKRFPGLLQGQMEQESRFHRGRVSSKGAMGPSQFMPGTWERYAKGKDPNDADAAIDAQAHYMSDLLLKHKGNVRAALGEYYGGGPGSQYVDDVLTRTQKYAHVTSEGTTAPLHKLATRGQKPKPNVDFNKPPRRTAGAGGAKPNVEFNKPPAGKPPEKTSSLGPNIRSGMISSLQG